MKITKQLIRDVIADINENHIPNHYYCAICSIIYLKSIPNGLFETLELKEDLQQYASIYLENPHLDADNHWFKPVPGEEDFIIRWFKPRLEFLEWVLLHCPD